MARGRRRRVVVLVSDGEAKWSHSLDLRERLDAVELGAGELVAEAIGEKGRIIRARARVFKQGVSKRTIRHQRTKPLVRAKLELMVELLRRYSNHHGLVTPLVRVLRRIQAGDQSGQPAPPSFRWLSSRLAASDPDAMTKRYLAGETAAALAKRYNISLKSVRRILEERGARKRV